MTVDNIVCSNSRRVPTVDGGNCAGGGGGRGVYDGRQLFSERQQYISKNQLNKFSL